MAKLLDEMTWYEAKDAIEQEKILFIAFGALEQHGSHLPLNVDTLLPFEFCKRVAERVNGIVAPPLPYGYKSLLRAGGGPHFPGSLGLTGKTLITLTEEIIGGFIDQGWKKILVLDWHLENVTFTFEGVDEALKKSGKTDVKIIKIDNPNGLACAEDPTLLVDIMGDDFPGWAVEHAAIWETTAMMGIAPHLVRFDRIVDGHPPEPMEYDVFPVPICAAPETGIYWKASRARMENGQRLVKAVVDGIVKIIEKEFRYGCIV